MKLPSAVQRHACSLFCSLLALLLEDPHVFVARNHCNSLSRSPPVVLALELSVAYYRFSRLSFVCYRTLFSRAAAAEGEDQVQCRAALEGVLFGGLVVGPVGEGWLVHVS